MVVATAPVFSHAVVFVRTDEGVAPDLGAKGPAEAFDLGVLGLMSMLF